MRRLYFAGLAGVVFLFALALLAPLLAPLPAGYGNFAEIQQAPGQGHIFGTDAMGLDVFGEVVWGTRSALEVGCLAVLCAACIGIPLGLVSGYFSGILSQAILVAADLFLTLPMLPLAIIITAILGPSLRHVALVIGMVSAPRMLRVTRAATLEVVGRPYIEAARCLGIPTRVILGKYILRYAAPFLLVEMAMLMATAVLAESGISFLGLGDPRLWSWGKILQSAQRNGIFFSAWWCSLFPSAAITVFALSFHSLGRWLRERLNC
jgi:peptide/nickel transport system permease protein